jgi:hypothetical protein
MARWDQSSDHSFALFELTPKVDDNLLPLHQRLNTNANYEMLNASDNDENTTPTAMGERIVGVYLEIYRVQLDSE